MLNDPSKESNVKTALEVASSLVIPAYQDILQPAAKQVGKSLETIVKAVNIALAPIGALVWGFETVEQLVKTRVSEKLYNVLPENIITPPPQVAGPTIDAFRYCGHEPTLRELYANLLATSMDKNTTSFALPGYVDVIKNMSPDEAIFLKLFSNEKEIPLIDVHAVLLNEGGKGEIRLQNYSTIMSDSSLTNPDMLPVYIGNLCRLGLLEIPYGFQMAPEVYEELENTPKVQELCAAIEQNEKYTAEFVEKMLQLTSFGRQFLINIVLEKQTANYSTF